MWQEKEATLMASAQKEEATLMAPVLSSMETKQSGGAVVHSPLQRVGEVAGLETGGLGESQCHTTVRW